MLAKTLETIIGRGETMIDDVLKISVPRKDVRVTLHGFELLSLVGLTKQHRCDAGL